MTMANAVALVITLIAISGCATGLSFSSSEKINDTDCAQSPGGLACAEIALLIEDSKGGVQQASSDMFLVAATVDEKVKTSRGVTANADELEANKIVLRPLSGVAFMSGGRDRKSCRLVAERDDDVLGKICFFRCDRVEIARARSPAQLCPRLQQLDAAALQQAMSLRAGAQNLSDAPDAEVNSDPPTN
jgi:hypothetical protein